MPVSNQILVGKSVSPVFSETKLLNFQIWLGQRGFFSKMWREFWRGQKALSPGRTRGVGRFSRPVALSGRFSRSACRRLTARPGLDHCRRARSGSARPPIWPGAFSARRGIFRFCPVRPYLRPGGPVVRPACDRGNTGRFWASCGLLAGLPGLVMMAGGRARSIWGAGRALFRPVSSILNTGPVMIWPGLSGPVCRACRALMPIYRKTARFIGSFLLWYVVSPSIERWPAGLSWIRSRYAGRASPL